MQQFSAASESELTARLVKTFQFTSKVLDAETKAPVKEFKIIRGYTWDMSDEAQVNWEPQEPTPGSNGAYSISIDQQRGGQAKFMAIAEGYLPAVSPAMAETGWHSFTSS